MRILWLAGMAMLAAPLAAAPRAATKFQPPMASQTRSACPRTTTYQAYERGHVGKPRKLSEVPGAHQFAAVYRMVDGCEVPLIVRYNVGR